MSLSTSKLESLSIDELSALYDRVRLVLTRRIEKEKSKLEETLANLGKGLVTEGRGVRVAASQGRQRRKYPPVLPKYRNPANRSQTWAGRGKQPRWLVAQLKAGKKVDDFLIKSRAGARARA